MWVSGWNYQCLSGNPEQRYYAHGTTHGEFGFVNCSSANSYCSYLPDVPFNYAVCKVKSCVFFFNLTYFGGGWNGAQGLLNISSAKNDANGFINRINMIGTSYLDISLDNYGIITQSINGIKVLVKWNNYSQTFSNVIATGRVE